MLHEQFKKNINNKKTIENKSLYHKPLNVLNNLKNPTTGCKVLLALNTFLD